VCGCGVFILKKNLHKQKSEKLLQKLVGIPFSFLLYKIALKASAVRILVQFKFIEQLFFWVL
jgi:hypothetical protein